MKRLISTLGLIVAVLSGASIAWGQADEPSCDVSAIAEEISALLSSAEDIDGLNAARSALASAISTCQGLSLAGSGDTVLDPIEIPTGIYRVTVTTEGSFSADMLSATGECSSSAGSNRLFGFLGTGDAAEGAEILLASQGCTVFIVVANSDGAWEIDFESMQ